MVDHLPLAVPQRPPPRLRTLTLLVGRMTTIKLAYWAALTAFELALPALAVAPIAERLPYTYAAAALLTAAALAWSVQAARAVDPRAGSLERSLPTVATTFVAASVVASPGSLPLLLIERQRSIEGCAGPSTCHGETLLLWAAVLAIGMVLIPAVFAASLRRRPA